MTPENIFIVGITQEPSTKAHYLVFCTEIHLMLGRLKQINEYVEYMQYYDFCEIKQIGIGGYGTVYTAKYCINGKPEKHINVPETVVLKRFKSSDKLFINEVSNL